MMAVLLSHDDVEMLLRELAGRLHTDGVTAGIRIVGGAAITLMNADRRSTADDLSHSLAAKGLAGATIKGSLIALSACLDDAVRGRLLTANPARGVTVPESARRTAEVVPPTTEQVRALLAELEGTDLERLVALIVGTGCRIGEALAVRWADLDLDGSSLAHPRHHHAHRLRVHRRRQPHQVRRHPSRGAVTAGRGATRAAASPCGRAAPGGPVGLGGARSRLPHQHRHPPALRQRPARVS